MAAHGLSELTVLYVEDDDVLRLQVADFLRGKCGDVLLAANGREALERYDHHYPDIIISDVTMPEIDGLEFAEIIKQRNPSSHFILTITLNDFASLQRALDIGVDNYVIKPIDLDKLHAAVLKRADSLLKTRALKASRTQLEKYHHAAEEERALVSELMKRMMQPERMVDQYVQYWIESADHVSGDLIAFRRSRNGRLYIMLADSTGHGLPAALNLLPVNHVFYSMVDKGLPVAMIVEEMNWAVKEQSPVDRFVSAFVACIDTRNHFMEVWNGGMPSAMLVNQAGEIYHSFGSENLPLGILDRSFTAHTEILQWSCHSQLLIYSDGFVEAENEKKVALGEHNIQRVMRDTPAINRFEELQNALHNHLGTQRAFDDSTLLMIDCPM